MRIPALLVRLFLLTLLMFPLFFLLPSPLNRNAVVALPSGSDLKYTVYSNGSVGVHASFSQPPASYTRNINLTHYVGISETWSNSRETDSISTSELYIGRNSSVVWSAYTYYSKYNHTISVSGPQSFTLTLYPNITNSASARFTIKGTYTFRSAAITSQPHLPSPYGRIYVIDGEEYQPPTVNFAIALTKRTSEVTLDETFNLTLTTFQKAALLFPFNNTDSFSLSGAYTGGQHTGTLSLHFLSGSSSPLTDLSVPYVSNSSFTTLSGSVDIAFNSALTGTPFQNRTAFQSSYDKTFGNASWVTLQKQQVNTTSNGKIQLTTLEVPQPTYTSGDTGAHLTFKLIFKGDLPKFLILGGSPTYYTGKLYNETVALWSGAQYVATYTRTSASLIVQSTSHLQVDLDRRINRIKTEMLNLSRTNPPNTQWLFLNSTIVYINSLSIRATLDPTNNFFNLDGLLIQPPAAMTTSGFRLPGLFNLTGYSTTPINFTLSAIALYPYSMHLRIPAGVPRPNSTSPDSVNPTVAVWLNFHNFTLLMPIEFAVTTQTVNITPSGSPSGLTLKTNSTVSNFQFNQTTLKVNFNVSGPPGFIGAVNVTIPKSLVTSQSNLKVTIDGVPYTPTITSDAQNYYVYVTYHLSEHTIDITLGIIAIPVFPAWTGLFLVLVTTLVARAGRPFLSRRRLS